MTKDMNLNEQLKRYFGFDKFKGDQEAIIRNLMAGNDTFVSCRRGRQELVLPAALADLDGTAIVISPLIALMKNQVDVINGLTERTVWPTPQLLAQQVGHHAGGERRAVGQDQAAVCAPESLNKEDNLEFFKSFKSRSMPSTRPTAYRSGATTSGPSIATYAPPSRR
jgi:ATP-dependent DNA helicase RecQ